VEGLIGEVGVVLKPIDPEGLVFVHGEYWRAVSSEKLEPGEMVAVEEVTGLLLKVKKASKPQ
jgi:membrane-bound serine protease (ClpP class)